MKKNIAVIGLGAMGSNHARVLYQLGALGMVFDTDTERSVKTGSSYGVPSLFSLDEVLASRPQAVCVATPTLSHLEIGLRCLNAGCHVFMEKPLAPNLEDAKQLVDAARQSEKIFTVGYIERFNPAFRALQCFVHEEIFGKITSVNIKRVGGVPRSADNVILDLMTHDINLLLTLFGRCPEHVYAYGANVDNILNSAQVLFDFGSASATCEANWVSPIKIRRIEITGTSGYCEVDLIQQKLTCCESHTQSMNPQNLNSFESFQQFVREYAEPRHQVTNRFHREPLKDELEAFIKATETYNTSQLVSAQDAFETLAITLQACKKGKIR